MTIICIKDGVVAADSGSGSDGMRLSLTCNKLARSKDGAIGGAAGPAAYTMLFREWFSGSTKELRQLRGPSSTCNLPIIKEDGDTYFATWIEQDGSIFSLHSADLITFGNSSDIETVGARICCAMAIGAMRAGASAEQAVAICIKYSDAAAGDVHSEKVDAMPIRLTPNGTSSKYMRPGFLFAVGKAVEEMGEVSEALGKTICWGINSFNPELPLSQQETNRQWVERKMVDVRGALDNLETGMKTIKP